MNDLNIQAVDHFHGRDVTRAELSTAFDRVADKKNWKMPIDRTLSIANDFDMELIRRAVIFFTASSAEFVALGSNKYRVLAAGYYATCGA